MPIHFCSSMQGRIQEFWKGGSKIKFMKGEGTGGGRTLWGGAPAAFLVFHLFSMKIKALSIMIRFQNNLI